MKEKIEHVAGERMAICDSCKWQSENRKKTGWKNVRPDVHCTQCGCTLSAKTRCLSCECPIAKWTAVLSENEEEELKKEI